MLKNLLEIPYRLSVEKVRSGRFGINKWSVATVIIALLVSIPILTVVSNIFVPSGDVWAHLASTVLGNYIRNSLYLLFGVGFGVLVIGVGTAWLVTMCEFPGRRFFEWGLLLPMAIPAYLLAYTYTDFLDFAGPVQVGLRAFFGWEFGDYWFPDIRSVGGAITVMSLVFYPYVYLLARAAFLEQSVTLLEVSRSLGCSFSESFYRVALPLARPAIVAGMALALMETLNDFGTVEYFGIQTFTTGIYRTWFGLGERTASAQLAAFLLFFILILILLERWSRRKINFQQSSNTRYKSIPRHKLNGASTFWGWMACFLPIGLGFLLPAGILLEMMVTHFDRAVDERFLSFALNSLTVAGIAGLLALITALIMAYGRRLNPTPVTRTATRIGSMGYAIPGSVIAVGILIPFGWFDNALDSWMSETFGISTGLLFSGTIIALVFAYIVRFLAVSFNTIESSLAKITPSMDEAAQGLGYRFSTILRKVHIPMMSGSLFAAIMLVFLDVMKELPATLIVRPFNFDTLAVQVYRLASDERLAESSGAALAIVLAGIIPVILLNRSISRSQQVDHADKEQDWLKDKDIDMTP